MISPALIISQIVNPLLPNNPENINEAPALFSQTLSNILALLLIVAGVAFFFVFIMGGIGWITSSGDKEKLEKAKKQITTAIIGLVLILSVFAVTDLIETLFGVNLIKFNLPRLQENQPNQGNPPNNGLPVIPSSIHQSR